MPTALLAGFLTGLSLIAAIGAQNAFVLRQGLRREHVGWVVFVCAASDAVLIAGGVAGFAAVTARLPWLQPVMLWAGVAFLVVYGALRFRAAMAGGGALMPAEDRRQPLRTVILTCLLFTWANPHVYLDTLVLIGGLSGGHAPYQASFAAGAMLASGVFFSALGFGARALAPVFARPSAWVWLEVGVGVTMWTIAATLVIG